MLKKERNIPLKLLKLQALHRRLSPLHLEYASVEKELSKTIAGYNGEKSLDYYLKYLPEFSEMTNHIFHDLRLYDQIHYFQLDTLICTPSFILILEVKNIAGKLYFDEETHQMIRTLDKKEEGFPDPILQVKWHQAKLKKWLTYHGFPPVPIDYFIVISHPSTIIELSPTTPRKILHSANLIFEMGALERQYSNNILTSDQLDKIASLLNKKHTPHNPDILKQFSIKKEDILQGVHCPSCRTLPMFRKKGSWLCPSCHQFYDHAHVDTLREYAMLIDSSITRQQFSNFLKLPSRNTISRIIQSMDLQFTGKSKSRTYKLPFEIE